METAASGDADGDVRYCGGKGNGSWRKRAREGHVESFGLSAVQVSKILILLCYGCNFGQMM